MPVAGLSEVFGAIGDFFSSIASVELVLAAGALPGALVWLLYVPRPAEGN